MTAGRKPWREPMLWLIAGLPIAAVAAGVLTIAAARRAPADASAADTRRIAQVQIEDLAPDREAARLGLQALLLADAARGNIEVRFGTMALDEDRLRLAMLHPLDAQHDRHVQLRRVGDRWQSSIAPWHAQAWELRLETPRGTWRLTGRLAPGAAQTALYPAVAR